MAGSTAEKEFLSPPEVAELLRVSHSKVLTWIATGDLRASDVASYRGQRPRWKVARQDLQDFLDRRAATPPPKTRRRKRKPDPDVTKFYE